jgi:hypothetical protein
LPYSKSPFARATCRDVRRGGYRNSPLRPSSHFLAFSGACTLIFAHSLVLVALIFLHSLVLVALIFVHSRQRVTMAMRLHILLRFVGNLHRLVIRTTLLTPSALPSLSCQSTRSPRRPHRRIYINSPLGLHKNEAFPRPGQHRGFHVHCSPRRV